MSHAVQERAQSVGGIHTKIICDLGMLCAHRFCKCLASAKVPYVFNPVIELRNPVLRSWIQIRGPDPAGT